MIDIKGVVKKYKLPIYQIKNILTILRNAASKTKLLYISPGKSLFRSIDNNSPQEYGNRMNTP
jgi:hypothetical protein